jgi:hypothetical protein
MHLTGGQTDTPQKPHSRHIPLRHAVSAALGASPDEVGPSGGFLSEREKSGLQDTERSGDGEAPGLKPGALMSDPVGIREE